MLVGIIMLALTAILLICVNKKISSDYSEDVFPVKLLSFLIGFILCAVITLFVSYLNTPITPLDVYKGKTTIQYTIVDGIKTDSCVVWKYGEVYENNSETFVSRNTIGTNQITNNK